MIYCNGPAAVLDLPAGVPPVTQPLVRPIELAPGLTGRLFSIDDEHGHGSVGVRVTERGHWYRSDDEPDAFSNDTVCRGCGHHGHFDYILDYVRCTRPPTAQDIATALLERATRPAPAKMRAHRIRFVRSAVAA